MAGSETVWICPACGRENPFGAETCAGCGQDPSSPSGRGLADPVQVAEILLQYADPPGYRERPVPGDPIGFYNAWFDGGAIRRDTGSTTYHFADGTKLFTDSLTRLVLHLQLPNGMYVTILQED